MEGNVCADALQLISTMLVVLVALTITMAISVVAAIWWCGRRPTIERVVQGPPGPPGPMGPSGYIPQDPAVTKSGERI